MNSTKRVRRRVDNSRKQALRNSIKTNRPTPLKMIKIDESSMLFACSEFAQLIVDMIQIHIQQGTNNR